MIHIKRIEAVEILHVSHYMNKEKRFMKRLAANMSHHNLLHVSMIHDLYKALQHVT